MVIFHIKSHHFQCVFLFIYVSINVSKNISFNVNDESEKVFLFKHTTCLCNVLALYMDILSVYTLLPTTIVRILWIIMFGIDFCLFQNKTSMPFYCYTVFWLQIKLSFTINSDIVGLIWQRADIMLGIYGNTYLGYVSWNFYNMQIKFLTKYL